LSAFELKTVQQIEDFARGCCFFGAGGGGSPKEGIAALTDILNKGKPMKITNFDELKDDHIYASVFLMGSVAPPNPELKKKKDKVGVGEPTYSSAQRLSLSLEIGRAHV
jgi:DUF917 family protein